jgi:hypothetical protein
MLRSSRSLGAVVVAGLLAVGAACGSDDDGDSGRSDRTSTSTRASGSPTSTTRECAPFEGTVTPQESPPGAELRYLSTVEATNDGCTDVVELTFEPTTPGAPPGFDVEYSQPPFRDAGEGRETTVEGEAFLVVRVRPAALARVDEPGAPPTYTGERTITPAETAFVEQLAWFDAFENQLAWVIGLDEQRPYRLTPADDSLTVTIGP